MQAQMLMPKLQVAGVNQTEIVVLEFEGKLALSHLYKFNIEFASKIPIQAQQVINQKAQLMFAKKGSGTTSLHGDVISFVRTDDIDDYYRYKISLMPKVQCLQHTRETQVFLDKSIPDIIKKILNKNGITSVKFDLMGEHKPKKFVFQYDEFDWNFITRWMAYEGIFYYFSQGPAGEELVLTDSNITLQNNQDINEIYYQAYTLASQNNPLANLVYNYQLTTELLPKEVLVKSYYFEQSSKPYSSKALIDPNGVGEVMFWAENVKSNKENQQLAKYISESYKWKKEILTGISSASFINPGTIINHKKFKMASLNIPMLIIESTYSGSQKRSFESLHSADEHVTEDFFKCEYKAINKSTSYRSSIQNCIPRITGMLPGFVDHEGDDNTVQINKKGFYKFRLAISDDSPGKGSAWVRKMESYIGDQYSYSLPLRKGIEVLIGFQFGNPDLPILIGSLSNSTHRNVITSRNQNYMGLYTKEKNMFFLNEQDGKTQGIQLSTPNNNTTIVLGTDNIFQSNLDAGFCLNTKSTVYENIGKDRLTAISGNKVQSIGGNYGTTVEGISTYENKGLSYYTYYGLRFQSVTGLEFNSSLGGVIDSITGYHLKLNSGWRYEQDTATSLRTAPIVMLNALESISLTVGSSSITINPESISILSPEISLVGDIAITMESPLLDLDHDDVNIEGIISAGPELLLGAGEGELAVVAGAEAESQSIAEALANISLMSVLKATATAVFATGKENMILAGSQVNEDILLPAATKLSEYAAKSSIAIGPILSSPTHLVNEEGDVE